MINEVGKITQRSASEKEREGFLPIDKKYLAKIRKILNDYKTPDNHICERIDYLEMFTRKIIRAELEKYAKNKR